MLKKIVFSILLLVSFNVLANETVKHGVDRIHEPQFIRLFKHKRVALLASCASVDSKGRSTVEVLKKNPNINLVKIFSPEHGLHCESDEKVSDKQDLKTHLPIISLYGKRKHPTYRQLRNVDVIVIDLQDVGSRYYTYATTMAYMLKAAKRYDKTVVVLDRVDPLDGKHVAGPVLTHQLSGHFAAYYPLPLRPGLTIGELARYFNRYDNIHARLIVIPLKHWKRKTLFSDTGLQWHKPSPALPSFRQAFLYNVFGAFESLNLSVGRSLSNHDAFKIYGAPWITETEARRLVKQLNDLHLKGLQFSFVSWTPNRSRYKNKFCYGFRVRISKMKDIKSFISLMKVLNVLNKNFPKRLAIEKIDKMLGSTRIRKDLVAGVPLKKLIARVQRQNLGFRMRRRAILLY